MIGGMPGRAAHPTHEMRNAMRRLSVAALCLASVAACTSTQGSPTWFAYGVLTGLYASSVSSGVGNGSPHLAQDGTAFYFGGGGTSLTGLDLTSGKPTGYFGAGSLVDPLAANACGVLYSPLAIARIGVQFGAPVLAASVDRAAIAGSFLYFHSTTDNAIGKLPLP
jgi:hypothetical protein